MKRRKPWTTSDLTASSLMLAIRRSSPSYVLRQIKDEQKVLMDVLMECRDVLNRVTFRSDLVQKIDALAKE
jgi:Mg-chelatase subunit ChlI